MVTRRDLFPSQPSAARVVRAAQRTQGHARVPFRDEARTLELRLGVGLLRIDVEGSALSRERESALTSLANDGKMTRLSALWQALARAAYLAQQRPARAMRGERR